MQGGQECCRLLPYRQGRLLLLLQLQEGAALTRELAGALAGLLQPRCAALHELLAAEVPGPDTWHIKGYRYLMLDGCCAAVRLAAGQLGGRPGGRCRRRAMRSGAARARAQRCRGRQPAAAPWLSRPPAARPARPALPTAPRPPTARRCSPLAKVGTLPSASLELLAEVRAELQQQLELEQQQGGSGGGGGGGRIPAQLELVCKAAHDCWAVGRVAGDRLLLVAMQGRGEREGGFLAAAAAVQALADAHFPGVFL